MEGNEEPWESLDIDETDLSAPPLPRPLLRRCNNRQPPPTTTTTKTVSPRHTIPGPAAAVQAAMHRNTDSPSKQLPDAPISTQEFIRRVEQDSGDEFRRNPWLFALHSLQNHGVGTTSLRDIKKCTNAQRIDKVVAIMKSCTQNGFGDMKITLKDPTDTIDATVHGKVLNAEEFGKLTVGSVFILQKVVAFSSSCMTCYLNITRRNIAKIISVECEVHNFIEAYHESTPVLNRNSAVPERSSALVCGRTERVARDEIGSSGMNRIVDLTRKGHCTQPKSQNNGQQRKHIADNILEEPVHTLLDSDHSGRTSQLGSGSLEGIYKNLQDLDTDMRQQARESSSCPSRIENLGSKNLQAHDAEAERLLQGNNCSVSRTGGFKTVIMPKNAYRDTCNVDDAWKQQEARAGISSAPGMVEKLAKSDMSELNGGPKSTQITASGIAEQDDQASKGANGVKKQRLALVSRTAVQEWTDEQLCILDMDED